MIPAYPTSSASGPQGCVILEHGHKKIIKVYQCNRDASEARGEYCIIVQSIATLQSGELGAQEYQFYQHYEDKLINQLFSGCYETSFV